MTERATTRQNRRTNGRARLEPPLPERSPLLSVLEVSPRNPATESRVLSGLDFDVREGEIFGLPLHSPCSEYRDEIRVCFELPDSYEKLTPL